jgi:hypothetical protein
MEEPLAVVAVVDTTLLEVLVESAVAAVAAMVGSIAPQVVVVLAAPVIFLSNGDLLWLNLL